MKFLAAVAVSALLTMAANAAEPPRPTYVQAGRLLADPATGRVDTNKTLVISDGKVVEIRDGFQTNADADIIDLRNAFVLPGLIDSHVHLLSEVASAGRDLDVVKKTSADLVVDGTVYAGRVLRAGFTTVADLGDDPDAIYALRDGVAEGKIVGPRIIAAGFVGAHGGHGDVHGFQPDILALLAPPTLCSGADECRRAVRRAVQRGAEMIKTASTGGVMSNTATGLSQQMTQEELNAVVETAHMLGRQVACHAHGADGINAALRAGVDSIEHGTYLDQESLRLMKEKGTYLVPTLLAGDTVTQAAKNPDWQTEAVRRKALQVGPNMVAAARRAREAGIKFAFGTDSAVSHHGENAREFALLIKAGFTPLDAIRTATIWGAAHLRLSDQIGALTPGKAADLIAVKDDPLKDVTELERITFVMKGGKAVPGTMTDGKTVAGRI
jgi:imidazolonepropionase-like amidohydrolase